MRKVTFFFLFSLFYISAFSQNKYAEFLKKNGQTSIKNHYSFDSLNLKNDYQIQFSKNDSLMFVNLIGPDTIYPILSEYIGNGEKNLGGLCADFDNCFFWGWALSSIGNVIGRIFFKEESLNKRSYYFIYLDKIEPKNYLLLADAYSEKATKFFFINVKTKMIYSFKAPKQFEQSDLKYFRFLKILSSSYVIKNIKTDKIFFFKKSLAKQKILGEN